jgi:hypothetical protein
MTNTNQRAGMPDYPDGAWTAEPDRLEFEHLGVPCILARGGAGSWCGYAAVPPGHPWHGKEYEHVDVEVHGGLTYARECAGHVCHVPKPGEPDDVWWLGFDCAHSGDIVPGDIACDVMIDKMRAENGEPPLVRSLRGGYWHDSYKTIAYVRAETERLAEQVRAAATTPEPTTENA